MKHPRSASRYPLKGATPEARQSRFLGVSGQGHCAPETAHRLGVPRLDRCMRRDSPLRRRFLGFTLIELLVAIAVMSMLALLSWRSIDGMTRTQTLTQQRSDDLMRMQAALGQWAADLDAVVETGEVSMLDFDGRVLRLTRRDSAETGLDSPGLRVVAWTHTSGVAQTAGSTAAMLGAGQWARWQSPPLRRRDELARAWQRAAEWAQSGGTLPENTSADSAIALMGIQQWQLFYHRGETWSNPLSAVGTEAADSSPANLAAMPNGVRLVLTLSGGQSLSGTVVRDWVRPTLEAGR